MSILRNKVEADYVITHNGAELDRATYNGTSELWVLATPYTVAFMDYPLTETEWDGYSTKVCTTTETGYTISTKKSDATTGFGAVIASAALPTQGCNKVKVKYSALHFDGNSPGAINGTAVNHGDQDQYLVFDCTGDEFTLEVNVLDATGYYTASITISEVSFYYEST